METYRILQFSGNVADWAFISILKFGGVAQWLGRRSVVCRLSLIYAWSVWCRLCDQLHTLWVRRPLWVNQLGQLSLPSLLGR